MPLALSPAFPADRTLFVGLGGRVMKPVRNVEEIRAGARRPLWQGADLSDEPVSVTALAVSPNYLNDGTLFAALQSRRPS